MFALGPRSVEQCSIRFADREFSHSLGPIETFGFSCRMDLDKVLVMRLMTYEELPLPAVATLRVRTVAPARGPLTEVGFRNRGPARTNRFEQVVARSGDRPRMAPQLIARSWVIYAS